MISSVYIMMLVDIIGASILRHHWSSFLHCPDANTTGGQCVPGLQVSLSYIDTYIHVCIYVCMLVFVSVGVYFSWTMMTMILISLIEGNQSLSTYHHLILLLLLLLLRKTSTIPHCVWKPISITTIYLHIILYTETNRNALILIILYT